MGKVRRWSNPNEPINKLFDSTRTPNQSAASPLVGNGKEKKSERDRREKDTIQQPEGTKEKERQEGNVARAESLVQTLSRAFSIMQIESDWLRSGFSTALLSFRAPEFSPRYASASCPTNVPHLSSPFSAYSSIHARPTRPTGAVLPRKLYLAASGPTSRDRAFCPAIRNYWKVSMALRIRGYT